MQAVTATGRLSSNKPNLQNIPVRTDLGKKLEKPFVARIANIYYYAQITHKLNKNYCRTSKDESMINAFIAGRDIHTETSSKSSCFR